jgi:hypothetical protein
MSADEALNGTQLDRSLDRASDVPPKHDPVEAALAKALEGATSVGQWDVVAQLARELEARRVARSSNMVCLGDSPRRSRAR